MRSLYNIYVVLFLFLLGPEAVAKSLPMKKVQTVETVWVPMTQEEVDDSTEAIEAVEIPENQQGAVPLFKEAQVAPPPPSREDPRPAVVSQPLPPGVQVQTLEGEGAPDQRPIIQVIYQGVKPPSQPEKAEVAPPPSPPAVAEEPVVAPVEDKPLIPPENNKKTKGDVYNFYFSS